MNNKLYVGNLSYETTENSLQEAFASHGTVLETHLMVDRETGRQPAYFEPLRYLSARRLALGVVDYEGDEERTAELARTASAAGGMEFAVATES